MSEIGRSVATATADRVIRSFVESATQTNRGGRRSYGRSSSVLAGKRYRGKPMYKRRVYKRGGRRKVVRRLRQPYKSQMKSALSGFSSVAQDGSTVSDPNCVYVTARTFNTGQVRQTVVYALLKALFKQAGIDVSDENEFIDRYNGNSRIVVTYRPSPTQSVLQSTVGGYASPTNTFKNIAVGLIVAMALASSPTVEFEQLELSSTDSTERWQLHINQMSVKLYCKTSLKMQNRSLNSPSEGETQSDDIDRCPVNGKTYRGYGTMPIPSDTENVIPFGGSASVVSRAFPAGNSAWNTVPDAIALKNVRYCKKIYANPGSIRTEIISHSMYISLDSLMQKIHIYLAAPQQDGFYAPLGKHVTCAFEKVIGNVSGNSQNVIITYEGEDKTYVSLYNKQHTYMKRGVFSIV